MNAPIQYIPGFVSDPSALYERLVGELPWVDRTEARKEHWSNDFTAPYTYGSGMGQRTYEAAEWHPEILALRHMVNEVMGQNNSCFSNLYLGMKNALDWHSDDDPNIIHSDPIAIISLGEERRIYFRESYPGSPIEEMVLGNGSLCFMLPGMQQTHKHKIPRHSRDCGGRISLTMRTITEPAEEQDSVGA